MEYLNRYLLAAWWLLQNLTRSISSSNHRMSKNQLVTFQLTLLEARSIWAWMSIISKACQVLAKKT